MVESYKGRKLETGQLVKVYYNLHKHVFSIKDHKTGLVLAHGNHIQIKKPKFQVMEKGRQRVLEENRKNVHAYVVGELAGIGELDNDNLSQYDRIFYDPKVVSQFMVADTTIEANSKNYELAQLSDKRMYAK